MDTRIALVAAHDDEHTSLLDSKRVRVGGGGRGGKAYRSLQLPRRPEIFQNYGTIAFNGEDDAGSSSSHGVVPDYVMGSPTFSICSPLSSPTATDSEFSPVMSHLRRISMIMDAPDVGHSSPDAESVSETSPLLPRKLMLAEKYNPPSSPTSPHTSPTELRVRLARSFFAIFTYINRRIRAHRRRSSGTLKPLILPRQVADSMDANPGMLLKFLSYLWQLFWIKSFW